MDSFAPVDYSATADEVPLYDDNGRCLSEQEREKIAVNRGICFRCGRQTAKKKGVLGLKKSLNDENVYKGRCIQCNLNDPRKIPHEIAKGWLEKYKTNSARHQSPPKAMMRTPSSRSSAASPMPSRGTLSTPSSRRRLMASEVPPLRASPKLTPRSKVPTLTLMPPSPNLSSPIATRKQAGGLQTSPQRKHSSFSASGAPVCLSQKRLMRTNSNKSSQQLKQQNQQEDAVGSPSQTQQSRQRNFFMQEKMALGITIPPLMQGDASKPSSDGSAAQSQQQKEEQQPLSRSQQNHFLTPPKSAPPIRESSNLHDYTDTDPSPITQEVSRLQSGSLPTSTYFASDHAIFSVVDSVDDENDNISCLTSSNHGFDEDKYQGDGSDFPTQVYLAQIQEEFGNSAQLRIILRNIRNHKQFDDPDNTLILLVKEILENFDADPHLCDVSVGALWRVAAEKPCAKLELLQAGPVDIILNSLQKRQRHSDIEYCSWTLGLLTSLCSDIESKRIASEKGVIEFSIALLSELVGCAGVFEWATRCMYVLVHNASSEPTNSQLYHENATKLLHLGGINALVTSMAQHDSNPWALLWALRLLWTIVTLGQASNSGESDQASLPLPDIFGALLDSGFVSFAVMILQKDEWTPVQYGTAHLFALLVLSLAEEIEEHSVVTEELISCIPSVVKQIMSNSKREGELEAAGCSLVSAMSAIEGNMQAALLEHMAIDAIVVSMSTAMTTLQENRRVIQAGAWALWNLSCSWKRVEEICTLTIPTVVRALGTLGACMATHERSEIHQYANGFAVNVCAMPGLEADDFGPSDLVYHFLSLPYAGGSTILTALCSLFPACCLEVIQCLGIPTIFAVFDASSDKDIRILFLPIILAATQNCEETAMLLLSSDFMAITWSALQASEDPEQASMLLQLIGNLSNVAGSDDEFEIPERRIRIISWLLNSSRTFTNKKRSELVRSIVPIIRNCIPNSRMASLLFPDLLKDLNASNVDFEIKLKICEVMWAIAAKLQVANESHAQACFTSILKYAKEYKTETEEEVDGPKFLEAQQIFAGCLNAIAACSQMYSFCVLDSSQVATMMHTAYRTISSELVTRNILRTFAHLYHMHKDELLSAGLIVITIDLVQKHQKSELVLESGCHVLAVIASEQDLASNLMIAETDGMSFLIDATVSYPSNSSIQREAGAALVHLCSNREIQLLASALGGMIPMVASLEFIDDERVLDSARCSLLELAADPPKDIISPCEIAVKLLRAEKKFPLSSELQTWGLKILYQLVVREEHIADGCIQLLVDVMLQNMNDTSLLIVGSKVLRYLALTDSNQRKIADAGGIEVVVIAMFATTVSDEPDVLEARRSICECLDALAADPMNRVSIREHGGAEAVCLCCRVNGNSSETLIAACQVLESLSTWEKENYLSVNTVSYEEVDSVLSIMRMFPGSEDIQVQGFLALATLLRADNAQHLISVHKSAVMDVVEKSSENQRLWLLANDLRCLLSSF